MVHSTLEESQDNNPNKLIIAQMRLNISPPEEYSGCSDLKVYKTFVAGILWWQKLPSLLGANYTKTQVQFLGMQFKGNASEWFTRNIDTIEQGQHTIQELIQELTKYAARMV